MFDCRHTLLLLLLSNDFAQCRRWGGGHRGKENPHQTDQNAWNAYENCKALLHCPTAAAWPPTFDP